jgi:glycosyltransferase involved in cell wall biosynthesis
MVLCVGSHEPRKNHLSVLHAAELLWREGRQFSLVFVGGNGWHGEQFETRLSELRAAGRPVEAIRALPEELLWAAYRVAHCLVFPSLNEGFGLPVAESLASGTPVITSGFGSMADIAAPGGALLVDPRDDHDLRDALRTMLTDPATHARLSREARHHELRTWEHYAADAWAFLVDSTHPLIDALPAGIGDR